VVDKSKFVEEEAMGYRLTVQGRNFPLTDAMKTHIMQKLSKLDRFHTHIMDIHVILEIHKLEHSCEILLHFEHFKIKVSASSTDMYASIDRAIERLHVQVLRWKDRIQNHHKKGIASIDMEVNVIQRPYDELEEINEEIEAALLTQESFRPPKVIAVETMPLKMLTMDEAVMKIELSGDDFLIYRGEEDQKLKVIYRRSDGHYGVIRTE
jgi:putative sigma-54 modulation protein